MSYRKGGPIPPILGVKYPRRAVIFDTEAYRSPPVDGVELQSLRLGVANYLELGPDLDLEDSNIYHFSTSVQLVDYIEQYTRKDRALYVYAHNLKYDLQLSGLLTGLYERGWKSSLFVIEDPPTFIRMKRGRFSIIMVDTFNYWQFSLSQMGEQLGQYKLKMPDHTADENEWFQYCLRDVEVLRDYLLAFFRFLHDNDLAGVGLTLASQAFRSYRHRFMQAEVILHNRPEVLELERTGYSGGRTDAFFIGEGGHGPYYKLDVNSMYPYVMRENSYPVELVGYSVDVPLARLCHLMKAYYCLAEVQLCPTAPVYACKSGEKLIFPMGTFTTVLHHAELVHAMDRGEVIRVDKLAIYNRSVIFANYVDYFYGVKLQAERNRDPITRQQAKLFMNSLYGKFGQREVVSKIIANPGPPRYDRLTGYSESLGRRVEVNYLGHSIELRYKGGESYYSSPVIAGAVTANARLYLWSLIETAGLGHVYYVDTDSLIIDQAGYDHLTPYLDLNRLGSLKVEGVEDRLHIYTVKDYIYGPDHKMKGVPRSARQLSDNLWQYEQFRGGKTWVKQGLPVGVEVYTRLKERKAVYDKGVVGPDGWVLPLRLGG